MRNPIKRLLVVEDDLSIRDLIKRALIDADFEVATVPDGPDALRYIERHGLPHLILLDLVLPTMHGFELSEKIKNMADVPIIILSNDSDEESVVTGIQKYAEDYITKPFSRRVLVARIRRVLSRIGNFSYAEGAVVRIDDHIALDMVGGRIVVDETASELTPIETRILGVLINHAGRTVHTEQILERVWPNEDMPEETLRVNISRLRRKFDYPGRTHDYIQTERGTGYRFSYPDG
jgi:DNA-binding response OmpR family regulator